MMIYVYIHDCGHPICNGYYHPSRVLSQVHTRGFMPGLSLVESQAMASFAQQVLPWVLVLISDQPPEEPLITFDNPVVDRPVSEAALGALIRIPD